MWKRKLDLAKDSTSWKRRKITLTKVDKNEAAQYARLLRLVRQRLFLAQIVNAPIAIQQLRQAERLVLERIIKCFYFPAERYTKLTPFTIRKRCLTIDSALHACGSQGPATFVDKFGFAVEHMKILAPLLIGNDPLDLTHEKRGLMGVDEAALLVCARARHVMSKVHELGAFFGRDPATICAFFREAEKRVLDRFAYLLELENLDRFSHLGAKWAVAFNQKYHDKMGRNLPLNFQGINCTTDGFRLEIAMPSEHKDIFINSYLGNRPTILFLVVTGANGMILALSPPAEGAEQDAGLAASCNLQGHLANAGLKTLCDSIFRHSANVKPLPKSTMLTTLLPAESAALSSIRISSEWSLGEPCQKFPLLRVENKHKVLQTLPVSMFRLAVLLQNCHRCIEGCIGNSYFSTDRITLESYLVPK